MPVPHSCRRAGTRGERQSWEVIHRLAASPPWLVFRAVGSSTLRAAGR